MCVSDYGPVCVECVGVSSVMHLIEDWAVSCGILLPVRVMGCRNLCTTTLFLLAGCCHASIFYDGFLLSEGTAAPSCRRACVFSTRVCRQHSRHVATFCTALVAELHACVLWAFFPQHMHGLPAGLFSVLQRVLCATTQKERLCFVPPSTGRCAQLHSLLHANACSAPCAEDTVGWILQLWVSLGHDQFPLTTVAAQP